MNPTGEQVRALYERGFTPAQIKRELPTKNIYYWLACLGLHEPRAETVKDAQVALQLRRRGFTLVQIADHLGVTVSWACTLVALSRDCAMHHNGYAAHRAATALPGSFTCTCPASGEILASDYVAERQQIVRQLAQNGMSVREIADFFDNAWAERTIRRDLRAMEEQLS